ncbi:MAG TPA: lysophospholipid acyltransferase family protein [Polyangiales bacterium]
MRKVWRLSLLAIIVAAYAAASPFGYGAFALLRLLPTKDRRARARKLHAIMRYAFTVLHDWLRAWSLLDFDPRISPGSLPEQPSVLVANHPAMSDVTTTFAAFENVTTAVKPLLFRRWWLRPLLDGARFFEGAGDPLDAAHVIEAGVERIREGFHVLIFPEGTRSPHDGVHRFGRTAFEIACRADAPVVPIVIACNPIWLSKTRGLFSLPDETPRVTLTALAPVLPAEHGFSSRTLRDVVEAHVRNRLGVTYVQAGGLENGTAAHGSNAHGSDPARGARTAGQEAHRRVLDA